MSELTVVSPSPPKDKCDSCGRRFWDGGGEITDRECVRPGDGMCVMVQRVNSLSAALRTTLSWSMIREPGTTTERSQLRTVLAVLESNSLSPRDHSCPTCKRPLSVINNFVVVHFPPSDPTRTRPCDASFKRVIAGRLID